MLRYSHLRLFACLLLLVYTGAETYFINYSPYSDYAPDYYGHMLYIGWVMQHWSMPDIHANWQAYQPPLYYFVAAIIAKAATALGFIPFLALRFFSLFCMMGFAVYGMLIIRLTLRSTTMRALCCLLLISWPLMNCLGGRISNEIMIYPFWAACYYYLLRWHLQQKGRDLITALGLCAVMMLIKTTALVPLGTVGVVMVYQSFLHNYKLRSYFRRDVIITACCILLAAGVNFARPIYYNMHHDFPVNLIVGNMGLDNNLLSIHIPNSFDRFTRLDMHIVMNEPFWFLWGNATGRQLFWNSYLKTMMFGFYVWPGVIWAYFLNVLLVALIGYAVIGSLCLADRRPLKFSIICIIVAACAQIIDCMIIQTVTIQEGRLTFPVIIPFLALLCQITEGLWRKWLYTVPGLMLLLGFLVSAECFAFDFFTELKPVAHMPHIHHTPAGGK